MNYFQTIATACLAQISKNKQTPVNSFLIILFTVKNCIHSYKSFALFSSSKAKFYVFKNLNLFQTKHVTSTVYNV